MQRHCCIEQLAPLKPGVAQSLELHQQISAPTMSRKATKALIFLDDVNGLKAPLFVSIWACLLLLLPPLLALNIGSSLRPYFEASQLPPLLATSK